MTKVEQMPRIAEYGSALAKANLSIDTVIRKECRINNYGQKRDWTLSHRSQGYTPAGSCMRWQESPVYRVTAFVDNATHGQSFLTLAEAEAYLAARGEL